MLETFNHGYLSWIPLVYHLDAHILLYTRNLIITLLYCSVRHFPIFCIHSLLQIVVSLEISDRPYVLRVLQLRCPQSATDTNSLSVT